MQSINRKTILLIFLILVVIYLIFQVVRIDKDEPLTEFYLLGVDNKAEGYPFYIWSLGETRTVTVGIVNGEFEDVEYLLVTSFEDEIQKKSIILKDSKKWEGRFNFTFNNGGRHKVEFLLFKDNIEPYRRLHLWVDVRG